MSLHIVNREDFRSYFFFSFARFSCSVNWKPLFQSPTQREIVFSFLLCDLLYSVSSICRFSGVQKIEILFSFAAAAAVVGVAASCFRCSTVHRVVYQRYLRSSYLARKWYRIQQRRVCVCVRGGDGSDDQPSIIISVLQTSTKELSICLYLCNYAFYAVSVSIWEIEWI